MKSTALITGSRTRSNTNEKFSLSKWFESSSAGDIMLKDYKRRAKKFLSISIDHPIIHAIVELEISKLNKDMTLDLGQHGVVI
ncbi:hypothetical protein CUMW_129900 [Citrus unshiu]|nr:hypothetical protein CUMW_129900 [Citrus unshiu]